MTPRFSLRLGRLWSARTNDASRRASRQRDAAPVLDPDRTGVQFIRSTSEARLRDIPFSVSDKKALYASYKKASSPDTPAQEVLALQHEYAEIVAAAKRRKVDPRIAPFSSSFFSTVDDKREDNSVIVGECVIYQNRRPDLNRHLFPFVSIEDLPSDEQQELRGGYIRRYFDRIQRGMDIALERGVIARPQPISDRQFGRYFDSSYWGACIVSFQQCMDRQPALASWLREQVGAAWSTDDLVVADCLAVKATKPREGFFLYPSIIVFAKHPAADGGTDLRPIGIAYEERPPEFCYPSPVDLRALRFVGPDEGPRWELGKTHAMQSAHLIFEIATHSLSHFAVLNPVAIVHRALATAHPDYGQTAFAGFLNGHMKEVLGLNSLVLSSKESIINCDENSLKFCLPCTADTGVNLIDLYYGGFESSFSIDAFSFDRWSAEPTGFGRYHDFVRGVHARTLRFARALAAWLMDQPGERRYVEMMIDALGNKSFPFPHGLIPGLPGSSTLDAERLARFLNCVIFDSFRHSLDHENYDTICADVLANFRRPIPARGVEVDLIEEYENLSLAMDRAQYLFNVEFNYSKSLNACHYFVDFMRDGGYFAGASSLADEDRGRLQGLERGLLLDLEEHWLKNNTLYPAIKSIKGLARSVHW